MEERTLGTEGDADSFCEDVDAAQHSLATIMGELNLLVGTTSNELLRRLLSRACASQS